MLAFDTEIRDQAYQFFIQEALEFLQTLETGLLTLRQERSIPLIHNLMRSAHSIKGGAASVGLSTIQHLAHQLENCIRALYDDSIPIDEPLEQLLLLAYDSLQRPLMAQIETGHHDEEAALLTMEPIYAQICDRLGDAMQTDQSIPSAAELGIDIVLAIFTGDVAAALTQLETLLQSPTDQHLTEQLQAQANLFINLGELVNLPGFAAIGRTIIQALQTNPHQALSIGQAALVNLQQAQTIVLAGDRVQGGSPSAALTQWLQPPAILAEAPRITAYPASESQDVQPQIFFGEFTEIGEDETVTEIEWADLEEMAESMTEEIDNSFIDINTVDSQRTQTKTIFQQETHGLNVKTELQTIFNKQHNEEHEVKSTENREEKHVEKREEQREEMVRVNLKRLDRMNNLMGEMVTQEHRSQINTHQLDTLIQTLAPRFTALEALTHRLDLWGDRTQIAQIKTLIPQSHGLDALQMDSYGDLHSNLQALMELSHQISEGLRDMSLISQQFRQVQREKQQSLKRVREDLLWARMLPIGDILQRFPRMVRDLSLQYGKQAQLKIIGSQVLVDKAVLQNLYDPLVHLLRNAIAHGVERPSDRTTKAPIATIEIRAYHRGNRTFIEIKDDGRGIDRDRIAARARDLGLIPPHQTPTQSQLYNYLFTPGFSTQQQVSDLAGRGVGLDVVARELAQLKGQITLQSEPGIGTQFTLSLPLTLTVAHLLVFRLKKRQWAIALDSLDTVITAKPTDITETSGQLYYHQDDKTIPISQRLGSTTIPPEGLTLLLVADSTLAIPVDQVLQEQELAIKPFGNTLIPPSYLYGCTLLGDGTLVPVIDALALPTTLDISPIPDLPEPEPTTTTLMVVDDSMTTRHSLTHSLKRAGYEVIQAGNGQEALDCLAQSPEIRMVFCDVEMPIMNGYEFLTQCRKKYDRTKLPIVMLTSRGGEKHRQIAQHLGANSYLTKPYLEPEVFSTVRSLIEDN
ncbi:MAG: hybrid sensor histidine kinase/response regulator [Alkalinema sp. RU_4_3]|nr:hybrid sensor histidine kinase/response regulator [Alkalinema sp. RU_4_3]